MNVFSDDVGRELVLAFLDDVVHSSRSPGVVAWAQDELNVLFGIDPTPPTFGQFTLAELTATAELLAALLRTATRVQPLWPAAVADWAAARHTAAVAELDRRAEAALARVRADLDDPETRDAVLDAVRWATWAGGDGLGPAVGGVVHGGEFLPTDPPGM